MNTEGEFRIHPNSSYKLAIFLNFENPKDVSETIKKTIFCVCIIKKKIKTNNVADNHFDYGKKIFILCLYY